MSPHKHSGPRSSRPGYTSSGHRRGSTKLSQDTFLSRRRRRVISPVLSVRERSDPSLWNSAYSARSLTKHHLTALGVSPSTFLVSPSSMRDGRTRSHTLKPKIASTAFFSQQMERSLIDLLIKSLSLQSISCCGVGDPKPSSHPKRRRS